MLPSSRIMYIEFKGRGLEGPGCISHHVLPIRPLDLLPRPAARRSGLQVELLRSGHAGGVLVVVAEAEWPRPPLRRNGRDRRRRARGILEIIRRQGVLMR